MKLPTYMTQVTKTSKIIALALFVLLPFIGFYLGSEYEKQVNLKTYEPVNSNLQNENRFSLYKGAQGKNDKSSYKYDLLKKDSSGKKTAIFSVTNWNGFGYEVSEDEKYIAIFVYGESMGDETFTLIDSNGKVLKNFGHLDAQQSIHPLKWIDHTYWIIDGVPIAEPTGVIKIDADSLEFQRFQ